MPIDKKTSIKTDICIIFQVDEQDNGWKESLFYINGKEIGQGMSLAGRDWTHISHHKTVGMGVNFKLKLCNFIV